MKISEQGLALLKQSEGFSATPYICPAGKSTIGYGHVIISGEEFTEIGADMSQAAFVAKPFNGGQIEAALRKLIQCRPARRRIEPSETRPPAPAARAQRRRTATFTSAPRLTKKQPKPSGGVRARRRRKPLRIAAGR